LLKFCKDGRIVVNLPALPSSGIHHNLITHSISLWDCFVQQDFSVILCFPRFSPFLSSVSRGHERLLFSGQAWFENSEEDKWLMFVSHTIISNTVLLATSLIRGYNPTVFTTAVHVFVNAPWSVGLWRYNKTKLQDRFL
jgi:hypothetical protein